VLDVLFIRAGSAAVVPAAIRILGYPANGAGDELALRMLTQLLADAPVASTSRRRECWPRADSIRCGRAAITAICIADLPPSPSSKTRYMVKRLRAGAATSASWSGRWAHPTLTDDAVRPLLDAGASNVERTLGDTRKHFVESVPPASSPHPSPRRKRSRPIFSRSGTRRRGKRHARESVQRQETIGVRIGALDDVGVEGCGA